MTDNLELPADELERHLRVARQIQRIWLPSRVLRSAGYFPPLQMLEVEQRGRDYRKILQFFGVPAEMLFQLVEARSKAAFFYQSLEGRFPTQTVDRSQAAFQEPPWKEGERSQSQAWGWT